MSSRRSLQAVAAFEAFKGLLALAVASGLLLFLHGSLHDAAAHLVEDAHLNPAAHYPHIFIAAATHLQDSRLRMLALGTAVYSLVRFVEAWGLFREAAWAELLAAGSSSIYIPFELDRMVRHPGALGLVVLIINLIVVIVMVRALLLRRQVAPDQT